ncbi:putative Fatty acid desaturase [Nitrosomonas nitrosa]|jgi:fatty acid desaturase|uniref:Fatty acid desaturase n=1 Tax=Nitrosomonas nitrosa TaxID=52442 RepID=A0A1I4T140_9PROT|nr:fatty acid desaturase [Nitrosomonas nitrosa]CAE6516547.1 putative Fatty acid desaturase [Nitrosomonas nitrosa]SFM70369.1 Fatty acid desaturase [Nitrosomonas nitrosa]
MNSNCTPDYKVMKASIADFAKPNPYIYWSDFLITTISAWGLFYLAIKASQSDGLYYLLIFLSAIGFYRALAFTHELAHLRKGAVPGFSFIWHVICGIPFLAPHFLYRTVHVAHHSKKNYGKDTDGEYISFGTSSKWLIIAHFLFNLLIPLSSISRFMIIAPISLFNSRLRLFVMERMSFIGLKFSFSREVPIRKSEMTGWYVAEFSCCLFCWLVFASLITKTITLTFLFQWYMIIIIVLTLNSLRTLGATHWYVSEGTDLNFTDQIKDSISIRSKSLLTKILCPVGTQYHALHHMFPSIPYHSLGKVYERLLANFPEEKILLETSRPNLFASWQEVWALSRKKREIEVSDIYH